MNGDPRVVALGAVLLLAGCSSAPPGDPTTRERAAAVAAGMQAFGRGRLQEAELWFRESLRLAREADAAEEVGDAAYNLGVCFVEAGRLAEAESVLREAEAALQRAGGSLADVLLVRAKLAMRRGEAAAAEELLARVLDDAASSREHRVEVLLARGALACAGSDVEAARRALASAAAELGRAAEPRDDARLCQLEGRVLLLEGKPGEAAALFDREAELHRARRAYRHMAAALARAGGALEDAAQPAAAADRLLRAARSRLAAGDHDAATTLAARAGRLAAEAGEPELGSRVRALREEIPKR